jgi:hypothetical protein
VNKERAKKMGGEREREIERKEEERERMLSQ